MVADVLLAAFAIAGLLGLAAMASREHRSAMRLRAGLLDAMAREAGSLRRTIRRDGFPGLSGSLPDGRAIDVELVPDTLQFRRLPQLWLKVTIREAASRPWPRIGALARPTGAEFYSLVATFPERLPAPAGIEGALLVRGDARAARGDVERTLAALHSLFADARLKEAAVTPGGIRIVRQAAEGDRGAHLLLRQVRFPTVAIAPDLLRRAVADAAILRAAQEPRRREEASDPIAEAWLPPDAVGFGPARHGGEGMPAFP